MLITKELQNKLEEIKIFGKYQMAKNQCACPSISFEHTESGVDIINPFIDECGWGEVNPIEYYGEEFLNSDFLKVDLGNTNKYVNTPIFVKETACVIGVCFEYETDTYNYLYMYDFDAMVERAIFKVIERGSVILIHDGKEVEIYTKTEYDKINQQEK